MSLGPSFWNIWSYITDSNVINNKNYFQINKLIHFGYWYNITSHLIFKWNMFQLVFRAYISFIALHFIPTIYNPLLPYNLISKEEHDHLSQNLVTMLYIKQIIPYILYLLKWLYVCLLCEKYVNGICFRGVKQVTPFPVTSNLTC